MKFAIKENSELFRNTIKRVIGIIVGLLKDRISINNFSISKRTKIKKFIKK
jgi:hypothetical protein